ncbi:VOC family protein [Mycetocola zhadangensis]|uniref:VOC family protein n=1 Tax=Mycetocola zhadangensis TaxID=1164595 RepID=A0A3L7JAM4_9MICO|nr:VOC family protein [Mycetocola zhadangensis]RLQ85562.1 VOC family protein [Mycetocola zhadangensis]GGE83718.1 glyoxalase [Mycetocola zhadangensis]
MVTSSSSFTVLPAADIARAREFYLDKLGLEPFLDSTDNLMYGSEASPDLLIYQTTNAGTAQNTQMCFAVPDIQAARDELRGKGVTFEDYDFGDTRTVDGIADFATEYSAWFKDSEGNYICLTQAKK